MKGPKNKIEKKKKCNPTDRFEPATCNVRG